MRQRHGEQQPGAAPSSPNAYTLCRAGLGIAPNAPFQTLDQTFAIASCSEIRRRLVTLTFAGRKPSNREKLEGGNRKIFSATQQTSSQTGRGRQNNKPRRCGDTVSQATICKPPSQVRRTARLRRSSAAPPEIPCILQRPKRSAASPARRPEPPAAASGFALSRPRGSRSRPLAPKPAVRSLHPRRPPAKARPSARLHSAGSQPAAAALANANLPRTRSLLLSPPVYGISNGAGRYPADQDVDAGMEQRDERKQRQSQQQREDISELAAVARG